MNNNNYGFLFNNITIVNNNFIKESKNEYGQNKINNEIEFYLFVKLNLINFSTPKLVEHSNGRIVLKYINDADTLTNKVKKENVNYYVNQILNLIKPIHNFKIFMSNNNILTDLIIEVETKILNRYNEYDWKANTNYNKIKYVNNIKINSINYYTNLIKEKLLMHLNKREEYSLIHGDIHLGNILIDSSKNIYFIDPRGYFGKTKLYGLKEYDYAKLMFGISGYSTFDNISITDLNIINLNLSIDFIKEYEYIFENNIFDDITKLLCLSIWLGNNSCFINENKKIVSLMIAFYYCEKYLLKL